jgi:hypothetical protein
VDALAAEHLPAALFLKPGAVAISFGHVPMIIRARFSADCAQLNTAA